MVVQELPKLHTRVRFPPPALQFALVFVLLLVAAGCAPYPGESGPARQDLAGPAAISSSPGAIHRVQRGETLWSIAKRYRVSVDALVRENGISDISRIEVGQRLTIPGSGEGAASGGRGAPAPRHFLGSGEGAASGAGAVEEFTWPVRGKVIAIFGTRWRGRVNKGIDIQSRPGVEVRATRSGKVGFVHEGLPGFGKTIILEHAEGFASVYAYVGEILVRQGEWVAQRQVIARVGETGRTKVPALHFEIRRNQKAQNPLRYLS